MSKLNGLYITQKYPFWHAYKKGGDNVVKVCPAALKWKAKFERKCEQYKLRW